MARKHKFNVGDNVTFNGTPYEIESFVKDQYGYYAYLLLNRLGYVNESEIKPDNIKR